MMNKKPLKKPRIGLYSMGLKQYWAQFPSLKERLLHYGAFIASKISAMDAEIFYFGLVDCEQSGRAAGEYFNQSNVDLLFAHAATYVTSASVLPVHQLCHADTVILNLQPAAKINYAQTTTGEWLAHCSACPVPELTNAFHRAGIPYEVVNGLLGLDHSPPLSLNDEKTCHRPAALRAWRIIGEWVKAARVLRNLKGASFGFLGNTYSGMLDMYSDFTMFQGQTKAHIQLLEMCDLHRHLTYITDSMVRNKRNEIEEFFLIGKTKTADPLTGKPTPEQLNWSARVACAQEQLVAEFDLDALTYYYHGAPNNPYEELQSGFIVGHSLLTAAGIPCAGEGDLKTCLAMKICDITETGGSFCEIVVTNYTDNTILLGHDGPFHLQIAQGKPVLRAMSLYHGKRGSGLSVEAKVRTGKITTLGCSQTFNGSLKLIITEAEATDGATMTIGNTQTSVKFRQNPDKYMDAWFAEAPTHHFAMSIGHNAALFQKVAKLLHLPYIILGRHDH